MKRCNKTPALRTGKDLLFGAANQPNITPEQRIQIAQGFLLAAIADALEGILNQISLDLPIHPEPGPLDERLETYVERPVPIAPDPHNPCTCEHKHTCPVDEFDV